METNPHVCGAPKPLKVFLPDPAPPVQQKRTSHKARQSLKQQAAAKEGPNGSRGANPSLGATDTTPPTHPNHIEPAKESHRTKNLQKREPVHHFPPQGKEHRVEPVIEPHLHWLALVGQSWAYLLHGVPFTGRLCLVAPPALLVLAAPQVTVPKPFAPAAQCAHQSHLCCWIFYRSKFDFNFFSQHRPPFPPPIIPRTLLIATPAQIETHYSVLSQTGTACMYFHGKNLQHAIGHLVDLLLSRMNLPSRFLPLTAYPKGPSGEQHSMYLKPYLYKWSNFIETVENGCSSLILGCHMHLWQMADSSTQRGKCLGMNDTMRRVEDNGVIEDGDIESLTREKAMSVWQSQALVSLRRLWTSKSFTQLWGATVPGIEGRMVYRVVTFMQKLALFSALNDQINGVDLGNNIVLLGDTELLRNLKYIRFFRVLVEDVAVVAKCRLSALCSHPKGRFFVQLVDLLRFYEGFEINDHVGTQLSDDDVLLAHYSRLQAFQLLAFKKIPKVINIDTKRLLIAATGSSIGLHIEANWML
eukprot:Gb_01316 [translate_table: standard]